ncbi:RNHCP domain-containing protein [candidate division WWE3 bacterium]|nr:RNHCP domain-containing protein [candidate division WWE3 bacterium]
MQINTGSFKCINCSKTVSLQAWGTKNRNHCPFCLYSAHVDVRIGDRKSACRGPMAPIGKIYKPDGEEVLVHQCQKCQEIRKNRVAGDDSMGLIEKLNVLEFF